MCQMNNNGKWYMEIISKQMKHLSYFLMMNAQKIEKNKKIPHYLIKKLFHHIS